MRYINVLLTYLLTYLLTVIQHHYGVSAVLEPFTKYSE